MPEIIDAQFGGVPYTLYSDRNGSYRQFADSVLDGLLPGFDWQAKNMLIRAFQGSNVAATVPEYGAEVDGAMAGHKKKDYGGIDLTAPSVESRSNGENGAIQWRIDQAQLQQLHNAPGFAPVILNIRPLPNVRLFLGLQAEKPETVLAKNL